MYFKPGISLITFAALAASTGAALSEEPPLQCGYYRQQQQVKCRVMVDEAKITKVTLNRGQCRLPEPVPAETQQKFKDLIASLPQGEQVSLLAQAQMLMSYQGVPERVYEPGAAEKALNDPDHPTRFAMAALLLATDPTGTYKFGDTVQILARNCDVLEYKMDINDREWAWTVH